MCVWECMSGECVRVPLVMLIYLHILISLCRAIYCIEDKDFR